MSNKLFDYIQGFARELRKRAPENIYETTIVISCDDVEIQFKFYDPHISKTNKIQMTQNEDRTSSRASNPLK